MQKYRLMRLGIFFIVLLICDWHISNMPLLKMREETAILDEDVLLNLFDSVNGYAGLMQVLVIYTLILLLCIYLFVGKDNLARLARYQKRSSYRRNCIKKVALIVILFSILHEVISIIFVFIHFEISLIQKFPLIEYAVLNTVLLSLLYLQVGMIYFIVTDLLRTNVSAIFVTFFIYLLQYWNCKFQIIPCWMPCFDLLSTFELLLRNLKNSMILQLVVRSILLDGFLFYLCQWTFNRKDWINHV